MNNLHLTILAIGLFTVSMVLVRVFCGYAQAHRWIDVPNERSSHQQAVPRGAGIVFISLWTAILCLFFKQGIIGSQALLVFLPGTVVITLLGYWDDIQGLSARKRLAIQLVAALSCVGFLGGLPVVHGFGSLAIGVWGIVFALGLVVWSTNAYNFMDGLDGLAALEALFIFGIGGFLFWRIGQGGIAWLSWALGLSVAGFLVWNWPKARVFMGDAGSCCLGFLTAVFALVGERFYDLPILLWMLLYSVFWFDATVTLIRRFIKGENLAVAHCKHAYQRLHKAGFSHTTVLVGVGVMNSIIAGVVIWTSMHLAFLKESILFILTLLTVVYLIVEYKNPMWSADVKN